MFHGDIVLALGMQGQRRGELAPRPLAPAGHINRQSRVHDHVAWICVNDTKPVPQEWLGEVAGRRILCQVGGGGQQGPHLAAAGAQVISLDASNPQLAQDRAVAIREGLELTTIQGGMANLSTFGNEEFDVIVNPASTLSAADLEPVLSECRHTLRPTET